MSFGKAFEDLSPVLGKWATIMAICYFGVQELKKESVKMRAQLESLNTNISSLNTKMEVIVTRVDYHAEELKNQRKKLEEHDKALFHRLRP